VLTSRFLHLAKDTFPPKTPDNESKQQVEFCAHKNENIMENSLLWPKHQSRISLHPIYNSSWSGCASIWMLWTVWLWAHHWVESRV